MKKILLSLSLLGLIGVVGCDTKPTSPPDKKAPTGAGDKDKASAGTSPTSTGPGKAADTKPSK